jgi:hypothetical protein
MFEEKRHKNAKPRLRCKTCSEILNPANVSGYCRECYRKAGLQSGAAVTGNPGRKGGKAMTITRRAKQ